ncbi:MAG TPA: hypothetical protein VEQ59_22050 [Polyangiaceae bacterium]|nr:hypothetical protein [Polyangiaceae bacterium]
MTQSIRWSVLLLGGALAACGGKSFEMNEADPEGGSSSQAGSSTDGGKESHGGSASGGSASGGSASGGTASGGSGHAGNAGAGSTAGSTTGGSGGTSSVCDGYDDEAGASIGVDIVNDTSTVIYLGQEQMTCSQTPLFDVSSPRGLPLTPLGSCRASCDVVAKQGPIGCPAACLLPSAITLQPGEAWHTTWDALFAVSVDLPPECVAPGGTSQCQQAQRIEPGTFTFTARAGSSLDCDVTTASGSCGACTPAGNGGCTTQGAMIGGSLRSAMTTVQLDSRYGLYGSAQPSPPNPGNNAGAAPAPALQRVQIIFAD